MSENDVAGVQAGVLTLTDEELVAMSSMAGRVWPRPLYSIDRDADTTHAVAAGLRSLAARGLLAPELPAWISDILASIVQACEDSPASLTLAVIDPDFVVVATQYPRLEVILVSSGPLSVATTPLGVHTFRLGALDQVLPAFAQWCADWSVAPGQADERMVAFARAKDQKGVAGYVLAPEVAKLERDEQGEWRTAAGVVGLGTLELLSELVDRVESDSPDDLVGVTL